MTVDRALFEFIAEAVAAAEVDSPLYEANIRDTEFDKLDDDKGICIPDSEAEVAPLPGGEEAQEFNAEVPLVFYVRIPKDDWDKRANYRDQATMMALKLSILFFNDPLMGLRVNDSRALRVRRGYKNLKSDWYAVANLDVIINDTGQQIGG